MRVKTGQLLEFECIDQAETFGRVEMDVIVILRILDLLSAVDLLFGLPGGDADEVVTLQRLSFALYNRHSGGICSLRPTGFQPSVVHIS